MILETVNAVSGLGTMCAAIVGVVVAGRGVHAWRHELAGRHGYELARRLALGIYGCRNKIKAIRHSIIWSDEMESALQSSGIKMDTVPKEKRSSIEQSAVYGARWNRLVEIRHGLDADILEAEVMWGSDWASALEPVDALHLKLYVALQDHVRTYDTEQFKQMPTERVVEVGRLIHEVSAGDEFTAEYNAAVESVVKRLRPHLDAKK